MGFNYNAMNEEDCQKARFDLIPDGEYPFYVEGATEKLSKAGNDMIELSLVIWDRDGKEHKIKDFLLATERMMWKNRHFCESTSMIDVYEANQFCASHAVGKNGKCKIGQQKGQPKDRSNPNGEKHPDRNVVVDYIQADIDLTKAITPNHVAKAATFKDDDLPNFG